MEVEIHLYPHPERLAEELQMTTDALAQWRYLEMGPRFVKEGRFVRYRRTDVEQWLEERLHSRTDRLADPRPDGLP